MSWSKTETPSWAGCCAWSWRASKSPSCAASCITTACPSTHAASLTPSLPRRLESNMATTTAVPPAPPQKVNRIGLEVLAYKGNKTTLCAGCGHNAITERIIEAFYEMGVQPDHVVKLSGIGCSSKSPAYFL